ncbi:hypothetical protein D3C75_1077340 [compost metagenome]
MIADDCYCRVCQDGFDDRRSHGNSISTSHSNNGRVNSEGLLSASDHDHITLNESVACICGDVEYQRPARCISSQLQASIGRRRACFVRDGLVIAHDVVVKLVAKDT